MVSFGSVCYVGTQALAVETISLQGFTLSTVVIILILRVLMNKIRLERCSPHTLYLWSENKPKQCADKSVKIKTHLLGSLICTK